MHAANTYTIRFATAADTEAVHRLATLDSRSALADGPTLLGELDGAPTAALSLVDDRVVADPFAPTKLLVAHMRTRAAAVRAHEREPSLAQRIRIALCAPSLAQPGAAQA